MKVSEKIFEVGLQSTIEISIRKGKVQIWGWENPTCKVIGEQSFNLDYQHRDSYLQLELSGGEEINIHLPRYSKLVVDGYQVDTTISNFDGNMHLEFSKGQTKVSNIDAKCILEVENGNIDMENIRGKWHVENSKGNIRVFKAQGNLKIENGIGDIELINISGECDIENGRGNIAVKEGKGSINIYNGIGDLTLDRCLFKRLASDGKGCNNIIISPDQYGVWRLSRSGNYSVTVPIVAQLDFQMDCKAMDNTVPGLTFTKKEDCYNGKLGHSPKGSLCIEEADKISLIKGTSSGVEHMEAPEDDKETLKILDMLKQGIVSLEEANELLEAIIDKNENTEGGEDNE